MAVTKSHIAATKRYNEKHYEQIAIRVPVGQRDIWNEKAAKRNLSLAAYLKFLVESDTEQNPLE